MASKQVTDRQKGADAVLAIFDAQGNTLSSAAGRVFGSGTDNIQATLGLLQATLRSSRDAMTQADAGHESELADDSTVRDARDKATAELTEKVVELRNAVSGLYGASTARAVFVGSTPQDPVALERFAGEVVQNLGSVTLPESRFAGATLDVQAVRQDIIAARETLQSALRQVASETREAQDSLAKKNQAIEEYDRVFTGVATTVSGLLTLVGERELAEKVRPSTRRPGQTVEQAETEPLG